jgi:MoaA/NifB/PqqE/SkfB family radical SAM enzyme
MRIFGLNYHKLRARRRYARPLVLMLGGFSPFPLSVNICVTLACNLRCEMCCQQQPDILHSRHADHMKLEDFEKILTNLERSFPIKPRLHISGGEPSLVRDFVPMVRHAAERGFICSVTSNGARIEEAAEELVGLRLPNITLSLDGVKEVHNRIRGRDTSYDQVVAAAKALRAARDRVGSAYPMITINCVITRHNYDRLSDMIDLTKAVGGDYLTIQHLIFGEGTRFAEHHIEDMDLLAEQLGRMGQRGHRDSLRVRFYPDLPMESLQHYYLESVADDRLNCVEPWLRATVMPNGDVLFCFSPIAGNALETPFDRIWRGDVLTAHRRGIARVMREGGRLPSDFCQRCCYRLYA